jgi:hypothetical protein
MFKVVDSFVFTITYLSFEVICFSFEYHLASKLRVVLNVTGILGKIKITRLIKIYI